MPRGVKRHIGCEMHFKPGSTCLLDHWVHPPALPLPAPASLQGKSRCGVGSDKRQASTAGHPAAEPPANHLQQCHRRRRQLRRRCGQGTPKQPGLLNVAAHLPTALQLVVRALLVAEGPLVPASPAGHCYAAAPAHCGCMCLEATDHLQWRRPACVGGGCGGARGRRGRRVCIKGGAVSARCQWSQMNFECQMNTQQCGGIHTRRERPGRRKVLVPGASACCGDPDHPPRPPQLPHTPEDCLHPCLHSKPALCELCSGAPTSEESSLPSWNAAIQQR